MTAVARAVRVAKVTVPGPSGTAPQIAPHPDVAALVWDDQR